MNWFRLYSEFASDPKVQRMPEAMQRRLIMVFCLQASGHLAGIDEQEIAFALHITPKELEKTKALFVEKGFIDEEWNVTNWEKRQFRSDNVTERVRRYREKKRAACEHETLRLVDETFQERFGNDSRAPGRAGARDRGRAGAEQIQNRTDEREREADFVASNHDREGEDLRDWREAIAELQGDRDCRLIAGMLQESAGVPSVAQMEAWRFIHAAHIIRGPGRSKNWEYFMAVARRASRKQFDAWHDPPPAESNGEVPREPPKARSRNAPQTSPEGLKALRDSLPDIETE